MEVSSTSSTRHRRLRRCSATSPDQALTSAFTDGQLTPWRRNLRVGTRELSIGPHRGRSTTTAEFDSDTHRVPLSQRVARVNESQVSPKVFQRKYYFDMRGTTPIRPETLEALKLLGDRVALARRERRWTLAELAERVGVSVVTMRKVERGDPSVSLGTAFEAATLVGVVLFHHDPARRSAESEVVRSRLAVLPATVRVGDIDDGF